ncbi:Hypothetical protein FKW44_005111 [Caligus rogercresseyi]|uniref:Uncharacterized protein n=1 Tax=Caligus rogercresseyi TaxID=217165 RepID=A0A7T8KBI1_CALRO|nr:Hypothetical protein FKW44_005111 [Caligus rogercresseyi]
MDAVLDFIVAGNHHVLDKVAPVMGYGTFSAADSGRRFSAGRFSASPIQPQPIQRRPIQRQPQ